MRMPHWNENLIYVFLFWEFRGLSTNFHIQVSVSDLYVYSQDRSTYFLHQNRRTDHGNIYICFEFSVLRLFLQRKLLMLPLIFTMSRYEQFSDIAQHRPICSLLRLYVML
jgi:hypothetical protein